MSKRKITHQQAQRIKNRQNLLAEEPSLTLEEGLVITRYGKTLLIENHLGNQYHCHCRQHLPQPVVGDRVMWHKESHHNDQGIVVAIKPRRTLITRERPHQPNKPLAANVTQMIIMAAPEPTPSPLVIDSYLVSAQAIGLSPLILFNKMDQPTDLWYELLHLYTQLKYTTLTMSVFNKESIQGLEVHLQKHRSIVVGQSGVGKSSLIRALLPHEKLIAVASTTAHSKLGKHTTVKAELYHLPSRGEIIDSPGVRQFSLGTLTFQQLEAGFREIFHFSSQCQFRNCQHHREPHCAIQKALTTGTLAASRWESYCHLKKQVRT